MSTLPLFCTPNEAKFLRQMNEEALKFLRKCIREKIQKADFEVILQDVTILGMKVKVTFFIEPDKGLNPGPPIFDEELPS